MAADLAGQVKLVKVDVDSAPELQQRFRVQAIPTLLIMRRGEVIAQRTGAAPASDLRPWVEANHPPRAVTAPPRAVLAPPSPA